MKWKLKTQVFRIEKGIYISLSICLPKHIHLWLYVDGYIVVYDWRNDCNVPTAVSFVLSLQNVKGNVWMFPLFCFVLSSDYAHYTCDGSVCIFIQLSNLFIKVFLFILMTHEIFLGSVLWTDFIVSRDSTHNVVGRIHFTCKRMLKEEIFVLQMDSNP